MAIGLFVLLILDYTSSLRFFVGNFSININHLNINIIVFVVGNVFVVRLQLLRFSHHSGYGIGMAFLENGRENTKWEGANGNVSAALSSEGELDMVVTGVIICSECQYLKHSMVGKIRQHNVVVGNDHC